MKAFASFESPKNRTFEPLEQSGNEIESEEKNVAARNREVAHFGVSEVVGISSCSNSAREQIQAFLTPYLKWIEDWFPKPAIRVRVSAGSFPTVERNIQSGMVSTSVPVAS